ncbi:unnamed protein product [Prunus armeniaca]
MIKPISFLLDASSPSNPKPTPDLQFSLVPGDLPWNHPTLVNNPGFSPPPSPPGGAAKFGGSTFIVLGDQRRLGDAVIFFGMS